MFFMSEFAQISLKRRMPKNLATLTYKIPSELQKNIKEGSYVKVPIRNTFYEGIVVKKISEKPSYPTKDIKDLIFDYPILQTWQIKLAYWIADYYKCSVQKVLQLFTPPKFYKSDKFEDYLEKNKENPVLKEKLTLTPAQKKALEKIINSEKKCSLLRGVTSSGKTEIYLHLVEQYIKKGKQSIFVVPEISLTPQMVQYFKRIFGDKVAILHSRLTEKQRSLEWMKIFMKETPIIIGPRSAIFAPVKNLGLIILDEEHEFSYKQEQAPRYHTLTVIKQMAELLDIRIVLGSATPSVSSYYHALENEYELVELNERIGDAQLPPVTLVDLREEFKKKNYSVLSELLQEKIANTLKQKKQTILFLNKRGSASAIVCRECGYMEKCSACDVPMTFHKVSPQMMSKKPSLICHHCGEIKQIPVECPSCHGISIKYVGAGTQKVEEEVVRLFPEARIARVDRDTIAKRGSFEEIYEKLKKGEIDILIGTQMIGKGLHFPNVSLVGVILADIGLHFPDFRSSERTFQILTQVAGRAGRSETPGEVIIQTYMPDNTSIQYAQNHDYKRFYEYEIKQRRSFDYPPFSRLVKLTFVDENAKKAFEEAQNTYKELKNIVPDVQNINLYPALIYKLHNKFRWHILLHGDKPEKWLENISLPENCRVDVDPISVS
jgi:primosomal protein N' (replication factor Y)